MKLFRIRQLVVLACAVSVLLMSRPAKTSIQDLPIFYPSAIPVKERESAFKGEVGGGVVYGRFKDFFDAVQQLKPEILVGPESVESLLPDYQAVGKFQEKGRDQTKYVALALNGAWKPDTISSAKMGAIEETDRDLEKNYLTDLFKKSPDQGASLAPSIVKTVSKAEDLFPLLVFKSVDYIVLRESTYDLLKLQFSAKVDTVKVSAPVNPAVVFVKKSATPEVLAKIKSMSPATLEKLGFSKFE